MNNTKNTPDSDEFEVIIIGGSYSGLSAAMAMGRSLRKVLIIDSNLPCNRQTPYSHNFITQDGKTPKEIATLAWKQVEKYPTVKFLNGRAISGIRTETGFQIETQEGRLFHAKKLIFATGIKDTFPAIAGFAECWGISVIHCPYCHGYEVKNEITGILGDGEMAMHLASLVANLTRELSIFTNGKTTFSLEQLKKLEKNNIKIIEKEIDRIDHINGKITKLVFEDGSSIPVKALYAKVPFVQHSDIPEKLGCELTEQGLIATDVFQQTTVSGVFACGDSIAAVRSVANAVATGNFAGAATNKQLCEELF